MSCMLACSLVHEGKENLSFSRIQIVQDSFERFPDDITMAQCRQCKEPKCVEACDTGALTLPSQPSGPRMHREFLQLDPHSIRLVPAANNHSVHAVRAVGPERALVSTVSGTRFTTALLELPPHGSAPAHLLPNRPLIDGE